MQGAQRVDKPSPYLRPMHAIACDASHMCSRKADCVASDVAKAVIFTWLLQCWLQRAIADEPFMNKALADLMRDALKDPMQLHIDGSIMR